MTEEARVPELKMQPQHRAAERETHVPWVNVAVPHAHPALELCYSGRAVVEQGTQG